MSTPGDVMRRVREAEGILQQICSFPVDMQLGATREMSIEMSMVLCRFGDICDRLPADDHRRLSGVLEECVSDWCSRRVEFLAGMGIFIDTSGNPPLILWNEDDSADLFSYCGSPPQGGGL